jgi:DNA modification methylase
MLTYKLIPTADLIPYARNSRTHSEAQVTKIASSIKEFGFINPVVTDGKNGIVAGHGRVLAANKLGLKEVPCVEAAHLTEAQKRAYVIADNRMALDAGWDIDLLKVELGDLQGMDFDLSLTGFDPGELENFLAEKTDGLTDPDAVQETPANPVTVLGDVWLMGKHRLMCGDSTSIDAVDKLMAGMKPNAVFTDPPYGIGLDKEGQRLGKSKAYGAVMNDHSGQAAKDAFALALSMNVPELYFWGANHYSSCLPDSSCWIVWDKQGGKSVTYADCELCYTNIDKPVRMFTHIWDGFRRDTEKGEKRVHANQKPVGLFVDIWSKFNMGQVVLDMFGGSGSTLLAAEKTNRVCYMAELDARYCDVIVKRWQDFTGHKATLESTGQTFEDVASNRYDWKKDSAASYDVAIAEKRKELEAST